jgi:hypothetical protein
MRDYDDNFEDEARDEYIEELVFERVGYLIGHLIEALYTDRYDHEGELEEVVVGLADAVGLRVPANVIKWQQKPNRSMEMAKFIMMGA